MIMTDISIKISKYHLFCTF